jgi:hypothetical protein
MVDLLYPILMQVCVLHEWNGSNYELFWQSMRKSRSREELLEILAILQSFRSHLDSRARQNILAEVDLMNNASNVSWDETSSAKLRILRSSFE